MTIKHQRFVKKKNNLPARKDGSLIPAAIAENPEKREIWTFLEEDLKARNIFSPTYLFTMEEIVEVAHRLRVTRTELDREGDVIPRWNKNGDQVGTTANPRFDMMMRLSTQLIKLIEKVGMSPRDIVFLQHTDASSSEVILEADISEQKKVVYFR